MTNKKSGTAFEKEIAEFLSEQGFWVHRLQDNQNGQPFDILAAKDNLALAVECKVCENGKFDLKRVEENQRMSLEKFSSCGNNRAFFAFKGAKGKVTFMPWWMIRGLLVEQRNWFDVDLGLSAIVFGDIV